MQQQLTSSTSHEDCNTSERRPTSAGSPDGNNHVLGSTPCYPTCASQHEHTTHLLSNCLLQVKQRRTMRRSPPAAAATVAAAIASATTRVLSASLLPSRAGPTWCRSASASSQTTSRQCPPTGGWRGRGRVVPGPGHGAGRGWCGGAAHLRRARRSVTTAGLDVLKDLPWALWFASAAPSP